jgi:outer membrane protein assembly factor BamB
VDDEKRVAAAALGLTVAGLAGLVVAWVLGDDFAEPTPEPGWTRVGTVVLALLLVALVWTRRQMLVVAVAVVGFGVTVVAVLGFVDQYSRGFPGRATVLAAIGGLAVTVAALLVLRRGPRLGWHPVAAVAFLLVPAVAVPLVLVAPGLRVDATTAGPARAAAVPASVSEVAWSTEVDGRVHDVVPAGAGVVVLLDDGVVALDGQTGEVRWRRARHGAEAVQVDASPDGRAVVVQFMPRNRFPVSREVIDAFTGEVRFTDDDANDGASPGFITPMTDASYIGADDDEQEFSGYSLTDGRRLWSYPAPEGCWLIRERAAQAAVADGMLLPLACGDDPGKNVYDEFRYVLVDGATGDVRWEHRTRIEPTGEITIDAQLAPDRKFVALGISADSFMTPGTYVVLDTADGDALPVTGPVDLLAGGIGVESRLVDVTTGETVQGDDRFRSCAATHNGVSLSAGVVCVDPALESFENFDGSGRIELAVGTYEAQELDLVPVTLGPRLDRTSDSDEIAMVAAPGAVVVSTPLATEDGGKVRVVGLR